MTKGPASAPAPSPSGAKLYLTWRSQDEGTSQRPVSGIADFPQFDYQGSSIVCDTGTLEGTADGTDRMSDVRLAFFGNRGVGA